MTFKTITLCFFLLLISVAYSSADERQIITYKSLDADPIGFIFDFQHGEVALGKRAIDYTSCNDSFFCIKFDGVFIGLPLNEPNLSIEDVSFNHHGNKDFFAFGVEIPIQVYISTMNNVDTTYFYSNEKGLIAFIVKFKESKTTFLVQGEQGVLKHQALMHRHADD